MKASPFVVMGIVMPLVLLTINIPARTQEASAVAQDGQEAQQACEGDVYALCGEAIPDRDRIVTCLRSHWNEVSKECRAIMASYGKRHGASRRGNHAGGSED